jgi:hypothetical protein
LAALPSVDLMVASRPGFTRPGHRGHGRRTAVAVVACLLTVILAACSSKSTNPADAISPSTTTAIPVDIQVTGTSNLRDGQGVRIHITAKPGSLIYGFEARLCAGGTAYRFDSDMRPTLAGKCVVHSLSQSSDDYVIVRASPPYQVSDGVFRVGVGSENFTLETGRQVTITCGHQNPCDLVLKVQYPNGFALRTFPLSYA